MAFRSAVGRARGWVACAALAALLGCASGSSGTRGERTVLMTDQDDARVGRQEAGAVAADIGLLDDPALDAWVDAIGQKLLRGVPRRRYAFQFRVVDQQEPNAFALPGGHVFVSRGLLLLANDEDELACVLGHEIVHVAKRHAAAQQALERISNPLAAQYLRAAQLASYSREMERQADDEGQILCAVAGYDPRALSRMLLSLEQEERLRRGLSRRPSFFDTHPGTTERAGSAAMRAAELRVRAEPAQKSSRDAYLRHIDGLAVGPRPEAGLFVGSRFLHPELGFQIRFPDGWRTSNTNRMVGASEPHGRAMTYLTAMPPTPDGRSAADAWLAEAQHDQKLDVRESEPVRIRAIEAWRLRVDSSSRSGAIRATATFIPYGPATFLVMGAAPAAFAAKFDGRFLATARSFAPLDDAAGSSLSWLRLDLATAQAGEDVAALGRRTGNAWDPMTTAVYNGVQADHRFTGGEQVKITRSTPYVPAR